MLEHSNGLSQPILAHLLQLHKIRCIICDLDLHLEIVSTILKTDPDFKTNAHTIKGRIQIAIYFLHDKTSKSPKNVFGRFRGFTV